MISIQEPVASIIRRHRRSCTMTFDKLLRTVAWFACAWILLADCSASLAAPPSPVMELKLRSQVETSKGSGRYHTLTRTEPWDARHTALIICDMWDLHHCLNAVRREEEFAPRLNQFAKEARARGVTIIHAPSDCMDAYRTHPAREKTIAVPISKNLPKEIGAWCSRIPAEERGKYPIDQSDGGEDDDPAEHRAWADKLQKMGRNPKAPWKKQSDLVTIEPTDYISDKGEEIWSILEQRDIKNVMLAGVHTNMCVLGRPFGLRQMASNGKTVVLVRDLTDTMYNPERWPYVSHFTGTDRIVEHIEKFVCQTITSDQLLRGKPFRFKNDTRPHVVLVVAEDMYETQKTLPAFAARFLGKDFRVSTVFPRDSNPNDLPGLDILDEADVLLLSLRGRVLPLDQKETLRRFARDGKAIVGVRAANHALAGRRGTTRPGHVSWPEFDREVFGGNYLSDNIPSDEPPQPRTLVRLAPGAEQHPVATGIAKEEFRLRSWLHKTTPLDKRATALLVGRLADRPDEQPVAWTYSRRDGGRSFHTTLGHPDDFAQPDFQRLLVNALYWAAGSPIPKNFRPATEADLYKTQWNRMPVPSTLADASRGALAYWKGPAWYRCLVKVPKSWAGREVILVLEPLRGAFEVYFNGHSLRAASKEATAQGPAAGPLTFSVTADRLEAGELNLLALRLTTDKHGGLTGAPEVRCGKERLSLQGDWHFRIGDDPSWARYALPAKFASGTDVIFEAVSTKAR
jgi:nicotinamidase-related amidase